MGCDFPCGDDGDISRHEQSAVRIRSPQVVAVFISIALSRGSSSAESFCLIFHFIHFSVLGLCHVEVGLSKAKRQLEAGGIGN